MRGERNQFLVLYRSFLRQTVDIELLSSGGDMQALFGQIAAILLAFNFVTAIVTVPRYFTSTLTAQVLRTNAWSDEEFLISATLSVLAVLMILAWDALNPDLRDALVLGVLPIRTRIVFLAKLAALGSLLAGAVLLINLFTSVGYSLIAANSNEGLAILRCFASYWLTMAGAAVFIACSILAIQGLAMQLLKYRDFLRVSSYLQLGIFFIVLTVFFLKPPLATPQGLSAPENQGWIRWLPSFWFLGLFQELNGGANSLFEPLAVRAGLAIAISIAAALGVVASAYRWNLQRLLQEPEITPAVRFRPITTALDSALSRLHWTPLDRAVVAFIARTLARSRKHRLLLALYGGIGLAVALVFAVNLIPNDGITHWTDPGPALVIGSIVVLFFGILGTRVAFTLPFALRSNWVFRTTAVESSTAYFQAVRKSLYLVVALPLWGTFAVFFLVAWPLALALKHLAVLGFAGVIIVERTMQGFRKIPFTCSYLPGRANLKVTLGLYGSLILFFAYVGGNIEFLLLQMPRGYLIMIALLLGSAVWAWRARARLAHASYTPIQFEDLPASNLELLDLDREGDLLGAEQ